MINEMKLKVQRLLGPRATDEFMDWLEDIGYFIKPASISHHGNKEGGLLQHSMQVAEILADYNGKVCFWNRPESPYVIGLLHDICKCDDYHVIKEWDPDSFSNEVLITKFEFNKDDRIMGGHGDKSVMMLAGRFPLTVQEARCIQFHMGAFTDKDQWQYYSKAISDDTCILYTHTADMLASQFYGM